MPQSLKINHNFNKSFAVIIGRPNGGERNEASNTSNPQFFQLNYFDFSNDHFDGETANKTTIID